MLKTSVSEKAMLNAHRSSAIFIFQATDCIGTDEGFMWQPQVQFWNARSNKNIVE